VPGHEESQTNADRLRRIQSVTDAALAHLQLDELLDALLLRIRDALEADTVAILLLDENTNELVARAAKGIEEEVEQGIRIPVGAGFAGRVAAEARPLTIPDVDHADVLNPILREKRIKSLLGAPLVVGGSVTGVIHVGTLVPRRFTGDDAQLLQLAAERAANAIEHARAYEAERSAAEELRKLQAITDAALGGLTVEELFGEILDRVTEMLATDTCAILLLDEKTNELVARAAKGIEEEVEQGVRIPLSQGFAGRVAAERRPVTVPDVEHFDIYNPILREKGIKSLLGVPLIARDRVLGVLHVGTLEPREFLIDDVELLQLAAERIAQGLSRAMVHDELIRLDHIRHAFVSIASHELRTPASSVLGAALTLRDRAGELSPETEAELRNMLADQAERLAVLLEQLLDVSRLEATAVVIRPGRIRIRGALEEIVTTIAPDQGDGIRISADPDLEIAVDRTALERIVGNLLTNALRYGEPPIEIQATRVDDLFRLAVSDSGQGVPADFEPRLFEQFSRSESASANRGSGLGLAIARSYAQAHGGNLVYDGTHRPGARFELVLPVGPTGAVRVPAPANAG